MTATMTQSERQRRQAWKERQPQEVIDHLKASYKQRINEAVEALQSAANLADLDAHEENALYMALADVKRLAANAAA